MHDIDKLINDYINQAKIYSHAIQEGNHKIANKANKKNIALFKKIENLNGKEELKKYLKNDDDGIRLCVASSLIHTYTELSSQVLNEIQKKDNIFSLLAEMGLDLWKQKKL